jgi:hypothetical protein
MNKEDYYKRIEDKLDRQTLILTAIKIDIVEEVSFLKLAHQKLKYSVMLNGALLMIVISVEYPKLIKFLRGIM